MKQHFRQVLRAQRSRLPAKDVSEKSRCIMNRLIRSELFQQSGSVFAYLNTNHEVQTRPLIEYCLRIGKPVFVPVTRPHDMFFSRLCDFSDLREGMYGIPEPRNPIAAEPDENSLFLIPGLGFDRCGTRLGYGAGYYDKYLQCRRSLHLLGICFNIQRVEKLPAEKTDIQMDSVLTEKEWVFFEKPHQGMSF